MPKNTETRSAERDTISSSDQGYLLTRWIQAKFHDRRFLWVGLFASVFPDLDMLYFYLIDDRQTLHHHYWTHLPLVWLGLWAIVAIVAWLFKKRAMLVCSSIFFANVILHFILDTFVGGINWLYPFVDHDVSLFVVPATHDFWVWSFVFHWTFLVEVAIVVCGATVFVRERQNRRKSPVKFS